MNLVEKKWDHRASISGPHFRSRSGRILDDFPLSAREVPGPGTKGTLGNFDSDGENLIVVYIGFYYITDRSPRVDRPETRSPLDITHITPI